MAIGCKSNVASGSGWLRFQARVVVFGLPLGMLVLSLMPPEQLDQLPGLCLWKRLSGHPCPACGTTHALCSVAHGDWSQAGGYNRNVYVLVPALIWIWFAQVRWLWWGTVAKSSSSEIVRNNGV